MDLYRSSILLTILALLSPVTLSMRYDLQSGEAKCISEDIHINSMSVGKYSIVNPNENQPLPASHKISVTVMAPNGGKKLHEAVGVESGQFSFTAAESGDFVACFSAVDHKPETTLTLDLDWRAGVQTNDWSKVAKRTQVEKMEYEVKMLLDTVSSIHEEMYYLRDREEEMQELNRSTNSKMAWMSFVSLGVCLSVAALQLFHLKSFFHKKKLI